MSKRSFMALAGALSLTASVPVNVLADQTPRLSVNARIIQADGGTNGSTSSPHAMVAAEGITGYVFASDNLCGVGAAEDRAQNLEALLRHKAHVWKVTRTGVSHANGKLTFDLEWTRLDGGATAAASGKQRITLAEGATYPIDMVRASSPNPCNAAAVMLEVEAGTIEQPAFADTVLQFDLWFTHRNSAGKLESRHFVLSGKQGAAAAFEFSPFRFDIPKLAADQDDLDVVTRIAGAIRGRLREDGKIAVELQTRRVDRLEAQHDARSLVPKAGGTKILELFQGETVEIELPATSGYAAHVASSSDAQTRRGGRAGASPNTAAAAPSPAVSLKDGMIVVNFKEFFANDRFSVTVRVRKAE